SAEKIAQGFVGSITMGTGQFCVNPGLVLAIEGDGLDRFIKAASAALTDISAGVMLNDRICAAYGDGVAELAKHDGVQMVARGESSEGKTGFCGQATLLATTADYFIANPAIQEEVFGPASLIVKCKSSAEIINVVNM